MYPTCPLTFLFASLIKLGHLIVSYLYLRVESTPYATLVYSSPTQIELYHQLSGVCSLQVADHVAH